MRSEVTQCATSLVAQNVNAVFTISIDPGPMGSTLNDAKERGIPFIGTVSEVAKTPLLIDYGSPGVASAQLSANWLFEEAKKRKGSDAELKFTILAAPTVGARIGASEPRRDRRDPLHRGLVGVGEAVGARQDDRVFGVPAAGSVRSISNPAAPCPSTSERPAPNTSPSTPAEIHDHRGSSAASVFRYGRARSNPWPQKPTPGGHRFDAGGDHDGPAHEGSAKGVVESADDLSPGPQILAGLTSAGLRKPADETGGERWIRTISMDFHTGSLHGSQDPIVR